MIVGMPLLNGRLVVGRENEVDPRIPAAEESVWTEGRGQSTKLMENKRYEHKGCGFLGK